jgi:hypothetical protein
MVLVQCNGEKGMIVRQLMITIPDVPLGDVGTMEGQINCVIEF